MIDHDPETGELREAAKPNVAEFTVSEISFALKRTLEDTFGHVRVRGEISGFRGPHSSGHCYFSLKDQTARIDAVVWRGTFSRLKSKLQEGLEVVATGKLTSYPGKSSYQIVIEAVEPAGAGALMALLEERKRKLAAEGLFDAARKKPIPFLPRVIGVVTSPTGAVIRDILHRLNDRFPRHVMVWPVRVQGETSAAEVANAIRGFNAMARMPDLLIVARGGGSLEDLWGFNEEIVVRAVAASTIPLIAAVGHETDWTLIDHVADERAPTPTAAAERAVPVRADLLAQVASLAARHERGLKRLMTERRTRIRAAARALPRPDDILALARQRFDSVSGRLRSALVKNTLLHRRDFENAAARLTPVSLRRNLAEQTRLLTRHGATLRRDIRRVIELRGTRLTASGKLLTSLSYKSVLQRGYALVRSAEREPLSAAAQVKPGQELRIEFHDGEIEAQAHGHSSQPGRTAKPREGGQGSLF
ncbi:exodeoxyribonuclease VII large subunit [Nordella sp. HKS 07]|uniref:exodeoxyribonuclease VII large subunit n=1 Tax=Nordella sp. HKS 07 TaxID=2712222 RepID=UPI0013E1093B|nr:exodeoxyribonuclease VII large subunit [Nordella sp. HKS 07]QIG50134.1 exodeoxyribonuclease VII large subunit [Nordella sp. HKS 07]